MHSVALHLRTISTALIVAVAAAVGSPHAYAKDSTHLVDFPSYVLFNRGVYDRAVIEGEVEAGRAERIDRRGEVSTRRIRHMVFETYQRSHVTTRDIETFVIVIESEFRETAGGPRRWLSYRAITEYVILDAQGQATSPHTVTLEYERSREHEPKWKRQGRVNRGQAQAFHDKQPEWIQEQFWLASGLLDRQPTQPVVSYAPTKAERDALMIRSVLSLAPGVARHAVGSVIENALRQLTIGAFDEASAERELRSGRGHAVNHPAHRVENTKRQHKEAGRAMWIGD